MQIPWGIILCFWVFSTISLSWVIWLPLQVNEISFKKILLITAIVTAVFIVGLTLYDEGMTIQIQKEMMSVG